MRKRTNGKRREAGKESETRKCENRLNASRRRRSLRDDRMCGSGTQSRAHTPTVDTPCALTPARSLSPQQANGGGNGGNGTRTRTPPVTCAITFYTKNRQIIYYKCQVQDYSPRRRRP